jgi:predicted transcriptional regulator
MNRKNPETSNEAYRSLKAVEVRETYRKILFALSVIKEGTFEDIARQCNSEPSVIWKRLSELANDGKIYRPGNKRPLKSGRNGYTWMLITPGIAPAKVVEMAMPGKTVSNFSRELIQPTLF